MSERRLVSRVRHHRARAVPRRLLLQARLARADAVRAGHVLGRGHADERRRLPRVPARPLLRLRHVGPARVPRRDVQRAAAPDQPHGVPAVPRALAHRRRRRVRGHGVHVPQQLRARRRRGHERRHLQMPRRLRLRVAGASAPPPTVAGHPTPPLEWPCASHPWDASHPSPRSRPLVYHPFPLLPISAHCLGLAGSTRRPTARAARSASSATTRTSGTTTRASRATSRVKVAIFAAHSWPLRSRQTASEGLGLAF